MPKPPPRVGVKNPAADKAMPMAPSTMMKSKEPPVVEKKESKEPKNVSKKMPKKEC